MDLRLSPVQVRNRLILAARRIVTDHTPDAEGICPVCGVLHCEALAVAFGYLARVDRPEPPAAVEIHRRAAVPPPGSRPPSCGSPPTWRRTEWDGGTSGSVTATGGGRTTTSARTPITRAGNPDPTGESGGRGGVLRVG